MGPILSELRRELTRARDPDRAPSMQAYMKSTMPYYGVGAGPLRVICKAVFRAHPLASATAFRAAAREIWRAARFREERYAAIELTGVRAYRIFQDMRALPLYEEMIVTGAWWDYVDAVAIHRLGPLLETFPTRMRRVMRQWSTDGDMWKRRSSILCQVSFKEGTDFALLQACIRPSLSSREFFLRKAIGWALRALAWYRPAEVIRYVRANADALSPLSKREALKNVVRSGRIARVP